MHFVLFLGAAIVLKVRKTEKTKLNWNRERISELQRSIQTKNFHQRFAFENKEVVIIIPQYAR